MRAVQVIDTTGPEHLQVNDVAEPTPGADDVLVEVHAVGTSFPDLLLSRGEYQMRPEPPFTLGVDFAGVVVQGPEGRADLAPGTRVAGVRCGFLVGADRLVARLDDRLQCFPFMRHVGLGGFDQIGDQIVTALKLHIDLRESVLEPVAQRDQFVVDSN